MKIRFNIDATENGKTHLDRDQGKLIEFPPKTFNLNGEVEIELTADEIAMAVASAPSNLGCEDARNALASKLMALWAKVAAK